MAAAQSHVFTIISAVLFIGKGETYLKLARLALQQNFDGKAVVLVSSAIENLTQ